jgi:hypothetical protein
MGVEYAHHFLVADPSWVGDVEVALRIHAVLTRWQLVSAPPEVFDLNHEPMQSIGTALDELKTSRTNLLIRYPHVQGVDTIAAIMGPSYYPPHEIGPRYFQEISVVVGTDFRIGAVDEKFYARVVQPPRRAGRAVRPHKGLDLYSEGCVTSYPADAATTPPIVQFEPAEGLPSGFTGIWRGSLQLDCGKDLPRIEGAVPLRISAAFTQEIEQSFGARLIQIGRVY